MRQPKTYDFSGWATKNDLKCSDGRTIRRNAFKDDDGRTVPLVWMHQHNDPDNVLGHAVLENRKDGVYAYCSFNDTHSGKQAKEIVRHGDVCSLSIWANNLKQNNGDVLHGTIKEVSVVLAGANPGAMIDFPMLSHGEEDDSEAYIRVDEGIQLYHADSEEEQEMANDEDERTVQDVLDEMTEEQRKVTMFLVEKALESKNGEVPEAHEAEEDIEHADGDDRTVQDVLDEMTEEQRKVVEFLVEQALESKGEEASDEVEHSDKGGRTIEDVIDSMTDEQLEVVDLFARKALGDDYGDDDDDDDDDDENDEGEEAAHSDDEGEDFEMKHNVFENGEEGRNAVLSHAEGMDMVQYAKENHVSLKQLVTGWAEENGLDPNTLSHTDLGINNISTLFPDYKLINGPEPELMTTDQGWISKVINKAHKSPMSRLRVRFADVRDISNRRAKGYVKGTQKDLADNIDLLGRTSDPTTVYISSKLDRDDIVDITDFDVVNYMYKLDRMNLNEEIARQIMIGDGRTGDKAIDKDKIRPIWTDADLFTIHTVVDVAGMRTTMNGSNSSANFGDNYVYAEAIIQSLLYAREQYKGSGNPDFFCTPHLVNVMLLARDLNGRRIYDNISDLKAALNVNEIITAEQFADKTRSQEVTSGGVTSTETRRLLGIMVNLSDYTIGATKGGEITHFTDFDIRFNQELSLLETRCSGMLTRPYSAIALEETVS